MERKKRVLLDEMYSGLKPFLKLLGWDVLSIEDVGLKGVGDEEIVDYVERNGFVLVTQDQKAADLARLKGVPFVLVGYVEIARMVHEMLKELETSS
jgi:predicted nuclease of predicted toxin-antitoxin system